MKIIECVPNFSEGKDKKIINLITSEISNIDGVTLLDVDMGYSTNRTVVTFAGNPESVIKAAFNCIKKASQLINMEKHKGEHPRMGATDVCPIIPVKNVSMTDCVKYSHKLAKLVGTELNIPVYMYEKSSMIPNRSNLSVIRSGEYEGFENKISLNQWIPDYGPKILNKRSGVTAIGAREFLIAYNINLNTDDKRIATDIALDIRESGRAKRDKNSKIVRDKNGKMIKIPGKFNNCKAVGWYIDEYQISQISINLTNFKKTSLHKVFEEVRKQARKRGYRATGSEIVGLLPKTALIDSGTYYLKKQKKSQGIPEIDILNTAIRSLGLDEISKFIIDDKIIENKINISNTKLANQSIFDFNDTVSRATPTPGGGSVSALAGSLGASLAAMVANLTFSKKGYESKSKIHENSGKLLQSYKDQLIHIIDRDSESYENVISAFRLPKKNKNDIKLRNKSIYQSTYTSAKVPLNLLKICTKTLNETYKVTVNGNPNSISDMAVANDMIFAASKGAIYNILINIPELPSKDQDYFKQNINYYFKQIQDTNLQINKFLKDSVISLDE